MYVLYGICNTYILCMYCMVYAIHIYYVCNVWYVYTIQSCMYILYCYDIYSEAVVFNLLLFSFSCLLLLVFSLSFFFQDKALHHERENYAHPLPGLLLQ